MRKLTVALLGAGLIWLAIWGGASVMLERGIDAWLAERRADGWVAEVAAIETQPLPTRMRTTLLGLQLADPETGVAWSAGRFTLLTEGAIPSRLTAIWPPVQTLATPLQRISIEAAQMQAGLAFDPGPALTLRGMRMALADLTLTSSLGWQAGAGTGTLTSTRDADDPLAHALRADLAQVALDPVLVAGIDPTGQLSNVISRLAIEGVFTFTAPWDRRALEEARPQLTAIDLRDLGADWDGLSLRAAGSLQVDAQGIPSGTITLKATNWREMLVIAVRSGAVPAQFETTIRRALEVLASLSGPPNTIDAPLSFANGRISLGPIPLGTAPRLVIR